MSGRAAIVRGARLAGAVCALAAGAAPTAAADETVYAGPPSQYYTPTVSPDQGEPVFLTNFDGVEHDVVAEDKGPDGNPLFRSALTSLGGSVAVEGTEFLTTGSYGFFCSLHATMRGTLEVTAAGTPTPRPGSSSPSSSPPPPEPSPSAEASSSSDTTAPSLRVRVADRRLSAVRRRRALRLAVTTDETAVVGLVVHAGTTRVARASRRVGPGTTTVRLRLGRALRRSSRLRLAVAASATDAAGNAAKASARTVLRG